MQEGNIAIVDLGTGSIRLTIFNSSGGILETRQCVNTCIHPVKDWTEQDAGQWWRDLVKMFSEIPPQVRRHIVSFSATGQREGIVPVDNHFLPLSNLITWLDRRTGEQAMQVRKKLGEEQIYQITGLKHNPAWSLSKILWIKEHQPEIYGSAFKFLQAVDFILSRMSGKAITDVSIASRTCMLDVVKRQWSQLILETFDIDEEKLPELKEPGSAIGIIQPAVAKEMDLPEYVQVIAGAGDQQAAALGVGAFNEKCVSIGLGTSSALSVTIQEPVHLSESKMILNCAALPGKWEYEPPIWNTGSLIKWYHENIDRGMPYVEILDKADAIKEGADGLIALPYFSGAGSPRWDPLAYGGLYGLTLSHTGIHILRALLESIAYEIRFNIESMHKGGASIEKIRLSGGASQNLVLCKIISDVLQIPVEIFKEAEASSWGLFCLVKNNLEPSRGLENIHSTLGFHITRLEPHSDLKDIYDGIYKKYIKLGDLLGSFATKN